MSAREKASESVEEGFENMNTNRGADSEGCMDYEKNQSSPISDKDFDNESTKMK